MGIVDWVVSKIRRIRYSANIVRNPWKYLVFGTICEMGYLRWQHDPNPQIFVMYSDAKYTHGINLHYLSYDEKMWIARTIYMIKKSNQIVNGYDFYKMMKIQKYSIVRKAYRKYFTSQILRPKMVSAGFTNLVKLQYTTKDQFIQALNKNLEPREIDYTKIKVAYSNTELAERINEARYGINIAQNKVE